MTNQLLNKNAYHILFFQYTTNLNIPFKKGLPRDRRFVSNRTKKHPTSGFQIKGPSEAISLFDTEGGTLASHFRVRSSNQYEIGAQRITV